MKVRFYINESDGLMNTNDNVIVNDKSEVITPDDDIIYVDCKGNIIDVHAVINIVKAVIDDIRSCYPSIYRVLMNKSIDIVDSPRFSTMATDGNGIFISPVFVQQLLEKDEDGRLVQFVLLHEMFHILFDHCNEDSAEFADHGRANAAQDYEINYNIETYLSEGIDDFPFEGCTEESGGLIDPNYAGMGWRDIYPLVDDKFSSHAITKTSQEWKDGFMDGYNEIMDKLLNAGNIRYL